MLSLLLIERTLGESPSTSMKGFHKLTPGKMIQICAAALISNSHIHMRVPQKIAKAVQSHISTGTLSPCSNLTHFEEHVASD